MNRQPPRMRPPEPPRTEKTAKPEKPGVPLWSGRKRAIFGLPWTFTRYSLTETCLFIRSGVFTVREEEIRLYRVLDITLRQSFGERLFGLGTIHLCTSDQSTPEVDIKRIKDPKKVRTLLSDRAEIERSSKLEVMKEMLGQASGADGTGHRE